MKKGEKVSAGDTLKLNGPMVLLWKTPEADGNNWIKPSHEILTVISGKVKVGFGDAEHLLVLCGNGVGWVQSGHVVRIEWEKK